MKQIKTSNFIAILIVTFSIIGTISNANNIFPPTDQFDLRQFAMQNGAQYKVSNTKVVSGLFGQDLAIYTTANGSDAIVDLFVLQGATGTNLDIQNAELVFSPSTIVIKNPADRKLYVFFTDNTNSLHTKINAADVFASKSGFGVVKYFSLNGLFTKTNLESLFQSNTIQGSIIILAISGGGGRTGDPVPEGGPNCISGGCASNHCSIDGSVAGVGVSCSVTCSSGYYSCCGSLSWTSNQCGCRPNSECAGSKQ